MLTVDSINDIIKIDMCYILLSYHIQLHIIYNFETNETRTFFVKS